MLWIDGGVKMISKTNDEHAEHKERWYDRTSWQCLIIGLGLVFIQFIGMALMTRERTW